MTSRRARATRAAALAVFLAAGCWRTGEPIPSAARVTWAAYPDTVRVGATFSFEFGGPVSATACGRLDTATVTIGNGLIEVAARRSTFRAVCANQRISFYEASPVTIDRAGEYLVRSADGRDLGRLLARDSGSFSPIWTVGEGTLREIPGCLLFGPGWIGNQRVFALAGVPDEVREAAGSEAIVHVEGRLRGFTSCGSWGSRPRIRADTAWLTGEDVDAWYRDVAR